jgi:hypothetical protein
VTLTASSTVDIATATYVVYNGSGTEVGNVTLNVGQTLTAGQSYTTGYGVSNGDYLGAPADAKTCSVVIWSAAN